MPARLPITWEKVSWRIDQDDLNLLRAVHGEGKVNEVVRVLVGRYAARLRGVIAAKGLPTTPIDPRKSIG